MKRQHDGVPIRRVDVSDLDAWTRVKLWLREKAFGVPFHGRYIPEADRVEVGGVEPGGELERFIVKHECSHIDSEHGKTPLPTLTRLCIYAGFVFMAINPVGGLLLVMAAPHFFIAKAEGEAEDTDMSEFSELDIPPNMAPFMLLQGYKFLDRSFRTGTALLMTEIRWMRSRWRTIYR